VLKRSRDEMRRILEARIDALSDSCRAVFVLRALEALSVEETAAALEIPQAAVRSRYARARGLLRESLAPEVDRTLHDVFGCPRERCDRIVKNVLNSIKAGT